MQYLFGLHALGHEVFWIEVVKSSGNDARDQHQIKIFLRRFEAYGFHERCALILYDQNLDRPTFDETRTYGMSPRRIREIAQSADLAWNFASGLPESLLALFRRRVLIDLDPGHLQVSALQWDLAIEEHQAFLSVGTKVHDSDCNAPTLGIKWHRFAPFVHLPLWHVAADPGKHAPFSSVTQWTWEEIWLDDRVLSVSKRDAYLKYIKLPQRASRPFELAANIAAGDTAGDRELLLEHGWKLPRPHRVSRTPGAYQRYIRRSRAEFQCPKPIHRELKTGWFSDRSVCYLATGRPVLAEDTGFGEKIPPGRGLLRFTNLEEAVAGVEAIDANYPEHMRAARELAEEYLNAEKVLPAMLSACDC